MFIRIILVAALALIHSALPAQERKRSHHVKTYPDALNFLVIGDWGQGTRLQYQVAEQMALVAGKSDIDFIVSAGDNFYPSGVSSARDELWKKYFESVYDEAPLQVPWYPVLGNHDYGGDPEAQIDYAQVSDRWRMPARYYHKLFCLPADSTISVLMLFIDTTPLAGIYHRRPGLAVHGQDTTAQLRWIERTLSSHRDADWIFVVGHHPIYTVGGRWNNEETYEVRRVLEPLFSRHRITAYLSGHEHNLQHISRAGAEQFISGGGSERRWVVPFLPRRFARAAAGFMMFSVLSDRTVVQVVSRTGRLLYRVNLDN